jgi:hypothetical protein
MLWIGGAESVDWSAGRTVVAGAGSANGTGAMVGAWRGAETGSSAQGAGSTGACYNRSSSINLTWRARLMATASVSEL